MFIEAWKERFSCLYLEFSLDTIYCKMLNLNMWSIIVNSRCFFSKRRGQKTQQVTEIFRLPAEMEFTNQNRRNRIMLNRSFNWNRGYFKEIGSNGRIYRTFGTTRLHFSLPLHPRGWAYLADWNKIQLRSVWSEGPTCSQLLLKHPPLPLYTWKLTWKKGEEEEKRLSFDRPPDGEKDALAGPC